MGAVAGREPGVEVLEELVGGAPLVAGVRLDAAPELVDLAVPERKLAGRVVASSSRCWVGVEVCTVPRIVLPRTRARDS
jgi:hypothetical protein